MLVEERKEEEMGAVIYDNVSATASGVCVKASGGRVKRSGCESGNRKKGRQLRQTVDRMVSTEMVDSGDGQRHTWPTEMTAMVTEMMDGNELAMRDESDGRPSDEGFASSARGNEKVQSSDGKSEQVDRVKQ